MKNFKNRENIREKNLIPAKPGQSGNPNGRPPLTQIEREAREASRRQISEFWIKYSSLTYNELKSIDRNNLPAIESVMVKVLLDAIKSGDTSEIHRMYNRILGAPKQETETNNFNITNGKFIISIATGKKIDQVGDGS